MIANGLWAIPASKRPLDRVLDKAVEDFFGPYLLGRGAERATDEYLPPLDVWELENSYKIAIDVPGFTMDRLEVSVHGNELTVVGSKASFPDPSKGECNKGITGETSPRDGGCCSSHPGQCRYREREERSFRRQIALPEAVNADAVTAALSNGVLEIHLPKAEQVRVKKIPVRVAN